MGYTPTVRRTGLLSWRMAARSPTRERATLRARLGAVVLDLEGISLLAWLTDPAAR